MISLISVSSWGQDERYYRKIFSGELPKSDEVILDNNRAQFNVTGPSYRLDLNRDGIEEIIQTQKRDGVDWIEIQNSSQSTIFESELLAMGAESHIYKMKLVNLSKTAKALVVFLDEGFTKGRKFESTGRFFVVTFDNNDLSKMWIEQGPHFFHEKESQREQYWRRDYNVNIYDVDGDGTREIAVMFNHIQRYMRYQGHGEWKRF